MAGAITDYLQLVADSFTGYGHYLLREVLHPGWGSYFYWLVAISLGFWVLELVWPWRRDQGPFRQDFWLDVFYMFFNYFLFSFILYNALSNVFVQLFRDGCWLPGQPRWLRRSKLTDFCRRYLLIYAGFQIRVPGRSGAPHPLTSSPRRRGGTGLVAAI